MARFHQFLKVLSLALACVSPLGVATAQTAGSPEVPFNLGVLPNVNARLILTNYQPMREYFQRELKRPAQIATAPDFRQFHQATQRGDYDMIVTAPNLGRLAQVDSKWEPLAMYEPRIPALLVALASNTTANPKQLQGKAVAMANPQSLVALVGLKWLEDQGLKLGKDFKAVITANDDSLGTVLNTGEAPLAIMSMGEFNAKPEALRKTLRIVTEITKLPGFLVMANPNLPKADKQRLKQLVLAFPQTEESKKFFMLAGVNNIRDVSEAELKQLDDVVNETRKGLAGGG
jgi:phosphonate transport system substrate-binding protein